MSCIHGAGSCGYCIQLCISDLLLFSRESWGCHDNCVSVEPVRAWPQHPHTSATNAFILLASCAVGLGQWRGTQRCPCQNAQSSSPTWCRGVSSSGHAGWFPSPPKITFMGEQGPGKGAWSAVSLSAPSPTQLVWAGRRSAGYRSRGALQKKPCKPQLICKHPWLLMRIPTWIKGLWHCCKWNLSLLSLCLQAVQFAATFAQPVVAFCTWTEHPSPWISTWSFKTSAWSQLGRSKGCPL